MDESHNLPPVRRRGRQDTTEFRDREVVGGPEQIVPGFVQLWRGMITLDEENFGLIARIQEQYFDPLREYTRQIETILGDPRQTEDQQTMAGLIQKGQNKDTYLQEVTILTWISEVLKNTGLLNVDLYQFETILLEGRHRQVESNPDDISEIDSPLRISLGAKVLRTELLLLEESGADLNETIVQHLKEALARQSLFIRQEIGRISEFNTNPKKTPLQFLEPIIDRLEKLSELLNEKSEDRISAAALLENKDAVAYANISTILNAAFLRVQEKFMELASLKQGVIAHRSMTTQRLAILLTEIAELQDALDWEDPES